MPPTTIATIDTLTDYLCHLVRIPSVTDDIATNRVALEWIEQQLSGLPLNFKRLQHNGIPTLIATTPAVRDPKKPKLWLAAHTDVAPGNPEQFTPVFKDGKLYGRGVFDMKYAIAVFITLLRELGPETVAGLDLGLMFTADEEIGGANGAGFLASQGYASKAMLLPECGLPWNLEAGAKGLSWWQITSHGQDAHGGYPWLGKNPFPPLFEYLSLIQSHFPQEPCRIPDHAHHSMTIGHVSGGNITNRVPAEAVARVDLRIMPGTSLDEVKTWFEEASAKFPDITAHQIEAAPGFTNPSDDATKLFRQLTQEVTGHGLSSKIAHASSDARYFASKGNQVICVPPNGGDQHSSGEWIDIEDLGRYYEVVKRFVTQWLK